MNAVFEQLYQAREYERKTGRKIIVDPKSLPFPTLVKSEINCQNSDIDNVLKEEKKQEEKEEEKEEIKKEDPTAEIQKAIKAVH